MNPVEAIMAWYCQLDPDAQKASGQTVLDFGCWYTSQGYELKARKPATGAASSAPGSPAKPASSK